ncbi:MAG: leucine-rich repeat protein [Clostridia bacterium]|nr:leucine-rich repeat protein [Clostridia bacterium]
MYILQGSADNGKWTDDLFSATANGAVVERASTLSNYKDYLSLSGISNYSEGMASYATDDSWGKTVTSISVYGAGNFSRDEKGNYYLGGTENPYEIFFRAANNATACEVKDGADVVYMQAFAKRTSLKTVYLPSSLRTIGRSAFYGCSALLAADVPEKVEKLGAYAFYGCENLAALAIENVAAVEEYTFANCKKLETVAVSKKLHSIEKYAFSGCGNLKGVNATGDAAVGLAFPAGTEWIGEYAFYNCASVERIALPASLHLVGTYAFRGCVALAEISVNVENSVYRSEGNALIKNAGNVLVTGSNNAEIADSVEEIGAYAFYALSGLKNAIIPDSVTSIGAYAFANCKGLQLVSVPKNAAVKDSAFKDCKALIVLLIAPENASKIASSAFSNGSAARFCAYGSDPSVYKIPKNANGGYHYFEIVKDGVSGDSVFYILYKTVGKTNATYADGTLFVYGNGAMKDYAENALLVDEIRPAELGVCVSQIVVGDGVTAIGENAFYNFNDAQTVQVGKSVRLVKRRAFYSSNVGENKLSRVYFTGDCPQFDAYAFENILNKAAISYESSAHGWSYGGKPYASFVVGEGLSTAESAEKTYYRVGAFVDLHSLDTSGADAYGVVYELTANGARAVGYTPNANSPTDIIIPEKVLVSWVEAEAA